MDDAQKVELFKDELKKMGITDTWKWEDANRVVQDSQYYSVLPTLKHRKQAFIQYVNEFKERMDKNKRENRRRQIDEFFEMLDQVNEINVLSKYHDCHRFFSSDRRYIQLDEKDREELFQDYMDELLRKELKRRQEHSKRKIDSLIKLFQSNGVTSATKFEDAKEKFKNNAMFTSADKLDHLKAFTEYMKKRIDDEDDDDYKMKIRQERKNREAYTELMEELVKEKKITYNSHWKEVVQLIKDDTRYHKLLLQSGSKPVDIFYDYQSREKDNFQEHKIKFKTLLKTKSVKLGANISKEDFNKNLSEHEEYSTLPDYAKDLLYDYYIHKVGNKNKSSKKSVSQDSKRHKHKKKHKSRKRKRSRSYSKPDYEEGEYVDKKP